MCKGGSYQEYGPDVLVTQPNWGGGGGGALATVLQPLDTNCVYNYYCYVLLSQCPYTAIEMVRLQLRLQLHC